MQTRYDMSAPVHLVRGHARQPPTSFWSGEAMSPRPNPTRRVGHRHDRAGGAERTSSLYFFSSSDSGQHRRHAGRQLRPFRFDVKIIAKATVLAPTGGAGGNQTCYMNETLSARASPLFSRAIFYNMDLGFAPVPTMNILGATHTNGNLYCQEAEQHGPRV